MPLYEYQCQNCRNEFEKAVPLKEYKTIPLCPLCGCGECQKILRLGGIQDDHPVWLNQSVRNQLQDTDSPHIPIESRTQFNRHLKENGIIAD